ncbi:phage tail protein [Escherichia coli]|uniref:phage tail protein n=3 Tax=Escherichia coli TaxID=562 RepID=UPI0019DD16B7|nr:phage tail protein [Escherichia coli]EKM8753979.1 tail fiber protein [Escherichia coli]MDF7493511.1 phage tail protein [Escherichia coli]MDF7507779.1 phage tail protein [Escherichia coli]MDF7517896.1 phage tail protein [Escherichia coli]MDF7541050.1 phage tail protein [Escherichia coli]
MLRIGQVEATATQDGKYTDGSVAGGIAATRLRAAAFNAMQEELAHIVESAGLALDINDMTQVLKAIQKLTLSRANPFADIKSDGAAAISTALTNLGLGEGSALPVGVPVPWPSATPPTGWLKCNGAPFSAEEYPKLAKAYPKLKLPDLRGEFIRGWDDGRGVDSARLLLSSQAASILEHNHEMHGWTGNPLMASDVYSSMSSVFAVQLSIGDGGLLYSWKDGSGTTNDSKRMDRTNHVSSGAGDGSPRNIAFNYIVRAA